MIFSLDENQQKAAKKWMNELLKDKANTGAIGGRFEFRFTPTGLGIITVIVDAVTKKELDLTDYDSW